MSDEPSDAPLEEAVEEIEQADTGQTISLGALLDSFEERSLGFILVTFGLIVVLPVIGAIPGIPDVAAIVILTSIVHFFIGGQQHFWAPDIARRQTISREKLEAVTKRIRPVARFVDGHLKERFAVLVRGNAARTTIAICCLLLTVAMVILSFVPFAATPAALGLILFGLALMSRDGLFAAAGYALVIISAIAIYFTVLSF